MMSSKVVERVLLVGAGMTSAATSFLISATSPSPQLVCWESGDNAGGRMMTRECEVRPGLLVDLGAQYIAQTRKYRESHSTFYEELIRNEVLQPLGENIIEGLRNDGDVSNLLPNNSGGMSGIVKHFLQVSGVECCLGRKLSSLSCVDVDSEAPSEEGGKKIWLARSECGREDYFNLVVLTMPIPEMMKIKINPNLSEEIHNRIKDVEYSSRYAVGLFYDSRVDVTWKYKYVSGNHAVCFISVNMFKGDIGGTSVLVHTPTSFPTKHTENEVIEAVRGELAHLLPSLSSLQPVQVMCKRWECSQVLRGVMGSPGYVLAHTTPPLIVTGDAFTHGNMDGCIESALATHTLILNKKISK